MKTIMLKGGKVNGDLTFNSKSGLTTIPVIFPYKFKKNKEYKILNINVLLTCTPETINIYKKTLIKDNYINVTGHFKLEIKENKLFISIFPEMISNAHGYGHGVWMVNIDSCMLIKDLVVNNYSAFTNAFIKDMEKGKNPKDESIGLNFNIAKSKCLSKNAKVDVWGIYHWSINTSNGKTYLNQIVDVEHFEFSPYTKQEKPVETPQEIPKETLPETPKETITTIVDGEAVETPYLKETKQTPIENSPFSHTINNLF